MKDFRSLKVWHKAHDLALAVYRITGGFPVEERYGLTIQIRRSSASVPTNIAEGCGRGGDREFARFLQIAMGSASELEYQLLLACDLGYLHEQDYTRIVNEVIEVKRMLSTLIGRIKDDARKRK